MGWSPTAVSGLEMSADGKKLYVICWDLHLMYTYNIADAAWSPDFLDVGGFNPSDIVSSPDKRYIYTINHKSDSVSDQS
ncbi:MAG: hypothetical protein DRP57_10300 [Spirochaetes bacterium]|nr:MAG: hypothetical protein DRP57_10300 [Spirochaetota bacterium]